MSKCNQCNIEVLDDAYVCPLCKCVLEHTEDQEDMYPSIFVIERKINLAIRIYLFVAIVTEGIMVYANYKTFTGVYWSAIIGAGLAYVFFVLKFTVEYEYGYRGKLFSMTILGVLYMVLIDYVLGYNGWSLNYVFPAVILGIDVAILVLMIVNYRNWQSYMVLQIFTILWGVVALLLVRFGVTKNGAMSEIALAISCAFFLGTLIIGGGRALTELKRRFHIR